MARARFRPPWLPATGRPRRLTEAEAAALKSRPWPRLPWWLWLAVLVTTGVMLLVALALVRAAPEPLPPAGGRSPPAGHLAHDVGGYRVPALDPVNRQRLVRRQAGCPRLAGVTLVGAAGEVELLEAAAERLCGLRSTAPVERARSAPGAPTVLVNGKFQLGGRAERITVLLVHEGSHVADGGPPTAAEELAARKAELEACQRLFTGDVQPNRGCTEAAALLARDDATALDELRKAGYR